MAPIDPNTMATRVVTPALDQPRSIWERTYLGEVFRGLGITITHLIKTFVDLRRNRVGHRCGRLAPGRKQLRPMGPPLHGALGDVDSAASARH